MADEDLLDSLDGGEAKPAAKKKLKLPSAPGGMGANLVPILIVVVILLNIFILMKAGGGGGKPDLSPDIQAIKDKMDQFNRKQDAIFVKLEDPDAKVEGVEIPTFALGEEDVNVYLNKGTPLTMNVGKSSFARTKILVVLDGATLPKAGHGEEGKEGGHGEAAAEGGHGGGGGEAKDESFGKSPGPWFEPYAANFEQVIQEFFSIVEYDGKYSVNGRTLNQPQLRKVLLNQINNGLLKSPGEEKLQLKDLIFEEFIIQRS